jgi:hypothetical protein
MITINKQALATVWGGAARESRSLMRGLGPQYGRQGQPYLNKKLNSNGSKQFKFWPIIKVASFAKKN